MKYVRERPAYHPKNHRSCGLPADNGVVGRSMIYTYTRAAIEPAASLTQNISELIISEQASNGMRPSLSNILFKACSA